MGDNDDKQVEGKLKLLLVEDDEFIWKAYKDGLSRAGYEVEVVIDGEGVVDKASEFIPNLILLDLILPGIDGFEVLVQLKGNEKLKSIPVVIVSNLGQGEDVKKAKELGAVDYLVKTNSSMSDVVNKVNSLLQK